MEKLEGDLKEYILKRYSNLKTFANIIGIPYTTLDSILKRGIANANIINIMKITKELGIDTESLASGTIVETNEKTHEPQSIAAHFDGDEYTEEERAEIKQFAEFVKNKRK